MNMPPDSEGASVDAPADARSRAQGTARVRLAPARRTCFCWRRRPPVPGGPSRGWSSAAPCAPNWRKSATRATACSIPTAGWKRSCPILNAQIDALDWKAKDQKNLRPTVVNALYRLLDDIKTKMSTPPAGSSGGLLSQGNAMMANMMIGALKPHVPEYADVVLAEMARPETKQALKSYVRTLLADAAKNTFGNVDMRWYNYVAKKHACADLATCQEKLGNEIAAQDEVINNEYLGALAAAAVAFAILLTGGPLGRMRTIVLLLFCAVLLAGGILTPMLEVEARITRLGMTFMGTPITFTDQSLYFQSKSVLEVFRTLIQMGKPEMWVVGVLVLLFSVVFPALKILTLCLCLIWPSTAARQPHREILRDRCLQMVDGRRHGAGHLHVVRGLQRRDRQHHVGTPGVGSAGRDPHREFQDTPGLLPLHRLLPGQPVPFKEARAGDRGAVRAVYGSGRIGENFLER